MPGQLFADIHCHPSFKPYAQSFDAKNKIEGAPQPHDMISLWHELRPEHWDNFSNEFGVAMYSQSNLEAAAKGGLHIIGLALGALEKEFTTVSGKGLKIANDFVGMLLQGFNTPADMLVNLVTRFGVPRLSAVRESNRYFPDLMQELRFVKAQEGKVFQVGDERKFYTFKIAGNSDMLTDILAKNDEPGAGSSDEKPITLAIVLSIEGLHNLDAGNGASEAEVLQNARALKSKDFPVFFVTFCHHFWNGLCGQARSLSGLLAQAFDQSSHDRDVFNELGLKVLITLMDESSGRRVIVDIKHFSYEARNQYFSLLDGTLPKLPISEDLTKELKRVFVRNLKDPLHPVIVSHAAVNGYADDGDRTYKGNFPAQQAEGVENPFEDNKLFPDPSINFYDTDLLRLGAFDCLIGIQLDMRRITGAKGAEVSKMMEFPHAYLAWNQVIHMVELWDRMDISKPWDRICIGSDFDGLVSPMDELQNVSEYPELRKGLLHYARLYFLPSDAFEAEHPPISDRHRGYVANRFQFSGFRNHQRLNPDGPNVPEDSGLNHEDIVEKICWGNALAFMKRHFK
jgi:hypothetical protein